MKNKTKTIYGIVYEVIDFKKIKELNFPDKNIYLKAKNVITKSIICKNLYVEGDQMVEGNQRVEGNQIVKGNQIVEGDQIVKDHQIVEGNQRVEGYQTVEDYQRVGGCQIVEGNQIVKGIVINSYCKWLIIIYNDTIKIGCKTLKTYEWQKFFKNKQSIETNPGTSEYLKIESAFNMAIIAQKHLNLINKPKTKI